MSLKFFLVTYDRVEDRVIADLSDAELKHVYSYCVQKNVPKKLPEKLQTVKEWELPWNDFEYQQKQFYEYCAIAHLTKNEELLKDITHVSILHWDVRFNKDSVNRTIKELKEEPNTIYYEMIIPDYLYLSKIEISHICHFMSEKMNTLVDPNVIFESGWIPHCLSIVPIDIFKRFGNYLLDYKKDIIEILTENRWGIMNTRNHKICGIVERMWGFYLISQRNMNFKRMNIVHETKYYEHKHMTEQNWIKK
jgi:hypothetical protein